MQFLGGGCFVFRSELYQTPAKQR